MEQLENRQASDRYQKYLIQLQLDNTAYYLVWGTDLSDREEKDNLLIDSQRRILLFSRVEQIRDWILEPASPLFDAPNLVAWAETLTELTVSGVYDLDYLASLMTSPLKEEQILQSPDITNDLIDFINLFGDYAYQLDDGELVNLHRQPSVGLFFDYSYDTYFWKSSPDDLQRNHDLFRRAFQFTEFKDAMNRLLAVFIARCHRVKIN